MAAVLTRRLTLDLGDMRRAVRRHETRDRRIVGWSLGLLLAGATLSLAIDPADPARTVDLLALVFAAWTLGWIVAPLVSGGGGEALRAEDFVLLPLPPRRLVAGLTGAALSGVGASVTLLAFGAAAGVGAQLDRPVAAAAVGVLGAAFHLVFVVTLARLVQALLGAAARTRIGIEIAAVQYALLLMTMAVGWAVVVLAVIWVQQADLPPTVATAARASPTGWSLVAVEAAARGDWLLAAAAPAGLGVLAVTTVGATAATGAGCAWWLGRLAYLRLERTGPELLHRMRAGPHAEPAPATGDGATGTGWRAAFGVPADLPLGPSLVVAACWMLFWLPLIPQGIVTAVFKLAGSEDRVWFLALFLPEPWQWPVIVAMISVGLALLALAVAIPRRHRASPPPAAGAT